VTRGTRIEIKLREDAQEFAQEERIREIIRKYSNFVGFPVKVNGEMVNTVQPLWTLPSSSVSQDQHDGE
jgi:HSP90 family molecular chaperone